jgi:hypothetical protein
MVKTIIALYDQMQTAQRVIESLLAAGFFGDDLSLMVHDPHEHQGVTGLGALIGALVGRSSTPGIALADQTTAALLDLGIDVENVGFYAEGLRHGGALVTLTTHGEWIEWAERIMKRASPLKIEQHDIGRTPAFV